MRALSCWVGPLSTGACRYSCGRVVNKVGNLHDSYLIVLVAVGVASASVSAGLIFACLFCVGCTSSLLLLLPLIVALARSSRLLVPIKIQLCGVSAIAVLVLVVLAERILSAWYK